MKSEREEIDRREKEKTKTISKREKVLKKKWERENNKRENKMEMQTKGEKVWK